MQQKICGFIDIINWKFFFPTTDKFWGTYLDYRPNICYRFFMVGGEIQQRIEEFSAEWYLIRYAIIATSRSVDKLLKNPREMHPNEEIIFPKSKKTDLAENHEKMMHEYESKNDRPVLGKKNFQKSAIRKNIV